MKQRFLAIGLLLGLGLGLTSGLATLSGCSSSSTPAPPSSPPATEDAGDGEEQEPTTGPAAYTEDEVQALFNKKCTKCHDADHELLNLKAPFTKTTVGVAVAARGACASGSKRVRIVPGNRDASLLWHKVKRTQDCGEPMPYEDGDPRLTATELERLGLWIDGLSTEP